MDESFSHTAYCRQQAAAKPGLAYIHSYLFPVIGALYVACNCCYSQGEDEPGLLEQCKSQICDNLSLYAQKYDEEFAEHLPVLVNDVWNLLVSCGNQLKFDMVGITPPHGNPPSAPPQFILGCCFCSWLVMLYSS